MNKEFFLISIFLLLVLPMTSAQIAPGIDEAPLVKNIQEGQKKIQELDREDLESEYLLKEWRENLSKNSVGLFILKFSDWIKIFNPLIKIILGYEYSLSWGFFFALVIWFALFLLIVNPASNIFGRLIGIPATIIIVSIIGLSGVIRKSVEMLAFILTKWWVALVILIIAIIIALILERVGKLISKRIRKIKEESEKSKTTKDRKLISADARVSKKNLESYN